MGNFLKLELKNEKKTTLFLTALPTFSLHKSRSAFDFHFIDAIIIHCFLASAVIVNDMAEINVDAALVRGDTAAARQLQAGDLVQLENGCICCTLRGDFLQSLHDLAASGRFDYCVVESTGISEPMQVRLSTEDAVARRRTVGSKKGRKKQRSSLEFGVASPHADPTVTGG